MTHYKFVAPSMNLALQKVKQELGKDAIIVSHESIRGEVHVTASHAMESSLDILLAKGKPMTQVVMEPQVELPVTQTALESPNTTLQLQHEIALIKRMLTDFQVPVQQEGMFNHALQFFFCKKLQEMGFALPLVKKILVDLSAEATFIESLNYVIAELLQGVQYVTAEPSVKYRSFIGPSGAGKTQLMVKIILHYLKNKQIQNFACIFVNHQNVSVLEESKLYARIFNVPCYYVESAEDLAVAIEKTQANDFVFIDFPAFDYLQENHNYYIPFIKYLRTSIHNTLVFSANAKNLKQYGALHEGILHELAMTKLDENAELGPFIQFSLQQGVPLGFMSVGQSYDALECAATNILENYLMNDLCPTRERVVLDKVFAL